MLRPTTSLNRLDTGFFVRVTYGVIGIPRMKAFFGAGVGRPSLAERIREIGQNSVFSYPFPNVRKSDDNPSGATYLRASLFLRG